MRDEHWRRSDGEGAVLLRLLARVTHLPLDLAAIEERLGRIEAGMESLRRALPPLLVRLPDAARALGVSYATIRRMKKDGRLPTVGSGRSARVDLAALHAPSEEDVARAATRARTGEPIATREGEEDDDGPT